MIICNDLKNPQAIKNVDEWFQACPPKKGLSHWKDGRSAKEMAKIWTTEIPSAFSDIFNNHQNFRSIDPEFAVPEKKTRFDNFNGEDRNHDLLIIAKSKHGKTVVCIEAKVDEDFGGTTVGADYLNYQLKRAAGSGTKKPARTETLVKALFDPSQYHKVGDLMYQLLTSAAGTIAEAAAQKADAAVLLVQVISVDSDKLKAKENDISLNDFLNVMSRGKFKSVTFGSMAGPISFPGNDLIKKHIPFYIGKIKT